MYIARLVCPWIYTGTDHLASTHSRIMLDLNFVLRQAFAEMETSLSSIRSKEQQTDVEKMKRWWYMTCGRVLNLRRMKDVRSSRFRSAFDINHAMSDDLLTFYRVGEEIGYLNMELFSRRYPRERAEYNAKLSNICCNELGESSGSIMVLMQKRLLIHDQALDNVMSPKYCDY
jgi:hypothetical protein